MDTSSFDYQTGRILPNSHQLLFQRPTIRKKIVVGSASATIGGNMSAGPSGSTVIGNVGIGGGVSSPPSSSITSGLSTAAAYRHQFEYR